MIHMGHGVDHPIDDWSWTFGTGLLVEFCFWTVDAAVAGIRTICHIRDEMGYVSIWTSAYVRQSIDTPIQGREVVH